MKSDLRHIPFTLKRSGALTNLKSAENEPFREVIVNTGLDEQNAERRAPENNSDFVYL
jgi:hypothetical protein